VRDSKGGEGSLVRSQPRPLAAGNLKGIAAMIVATAVFTCGDASMKLVSGSLPTGESVFVRGVCSTIVVTVAAFWSSSILSLRRAFVGVMGWRCAGDVGGALFFQAALARMPFADIMGILQMTPLSLTAASALVLGERVGWRRWTAVAIGFAGSLLVIKPASSAFNAWAILAVLAVLSGTLRDISTRQLDATLSPLVIMMLSQVAVTLAGLACASFETWAMPNLDQLLHLAFASIFSMIGHLCIIYSLRSGEISAIAPFRYAGMVWAILLGLLIWNQLPDALSFVGIFILSSAGLYTFYREQQLRRLRSLRSGAGSH
jgi:drug/metabolite transporter (DMT)-like permease